VPDGDTHGTAGGFGSTIPPFSLHAAIRCGSPRVPWYDESGLRALPPFGSRETLAPTPLADHIRNRLLALLADDRPVAGALLFRMRRVREREGVPAFSAALRQLAQLDLPEFEAETVLGEALKHRSRLREALHRDPGLRVSIADYLASADRQRAHSRVAEWYVRDPGAFLADPRDLDGPGGMVRLAEALEREISRSRRYQRSFSLLLVGIDRFTSIRANAGALVEGVLLDRVARMLRREIRQSDTGCSLSGGTLGAVLPETDRQGAMSAAARIRRRVLQVLGQAASPGWEAGREVRGSVCFYPEDATTPESILARAQESLVLAQRTGAQLRSGPSERRRFPRFPPDRSLRAWIGAAPDGPEAKVRLRDLSRGGGFLETDADLAGWGTVRVRFEAVENGEHLGWVSNARLVRVQRLPGDARASRIAVEFEPASFPAWLERHAGARSTPIRPDRSPR